MAERDDEPQIGVHEEATMPTTYGRASLRLPVSLTEDDLGDIAEWLDIILRMRRRTLARRSA